MFALLLHLIRPPAFPGLPPAIVHQLELRSCAIPQTGFASKPHNAIRGEFFRKGRQDWAVLCLAHGNSSILVFPTGGEGHPAELASLADSIFEQSDESGRMVYSRMITAVGKDFILRHYQGYGGPKPPPMDHQGVDDAFVEKASVTWYCYNGTWYKLTGSD